jgi:pyruvate/2-oxoglutarate dehydrogenase complex dihydrolipoamide dehydrogenase (E3) component
VLTSPPRELPRHLLVLGGGAEGCELAQAFAQLGSRVTMIAPSLLPRESPRVQRAVADVLVNATGIRWVQGCGREVLRRMPGEVTVLLEGQGHVVGSHLLVATGRKPRARGLGLSKAGVRYDNEGIFVDERQRTSAPHIMAAGDCCSARVHDVVHRGGYDGGFVEAEITWQRGPSAEVEQGGARPARDAGWQARVATQAALVPWWLRERLTTPARAPAARITYTQPEIGAVGLSEEEVQAKYGAEGRRWWLIRVEGDALERAVTDGELPGGFVEVYVHRSGRVLGASIVCNRAAELIALVAVAIQNRMHVRDLASTLHPHPSYASALHQVWVAASTERVMARLKRNPLLALLSRVFPWRAKDIRGGAQ